MKGTIEKLTRKSTNGAVFLQIKLICLEQSHPEKEKYGTFEVGRDKETEMKGWLFPLDDKSKRV